MKKYEIDLLSEIRVEFFSSKLYFVQSEIIFDKKELLFSTDAFYLNFPFEEAEKVIPFFERMKVKEQKRIVRYLGESYGFNTRIDDFFGKLLVSLFYNFELYDILIVNLAGLGDNSINSLIELIRKVIAIEKQKVVIMTKTAFALPEKVSVIIL